MPRAGNVIDKWTTTPWTVRERRDGAARHEEMLWERGRAKIEKEIEGKHDAVKNARANSTQPKRGC